jgi:hypothetical protein
MVVYSKILFFNFGVVMRKNKFIRLFPFFGGKLPWLRIFFNRPLNNISNIKKILPKYAQLDFF